MNSIQQDEEKGLLTAKQLQNELKLSSSQVYNLMNGVVRGAEDFPVIRIGRSLRVDRSALRQWLDRQAGGTLNGYTYN